MEAIIAMTLLPRAT